MFWPGLLRALKDLDPEDPYYISGRAGGTEGVWGGGGGGGRGGGWQGRAVAEEVL